MQHSARPVPAAFVSADEAMAFIEGLRLTMTELVDVLTEESALVRAAKIRAAQPLEARKTALSLRYTGELARLKAHAPALKAAAPRALARLEAENIALGKALEVNLAVLATAHAVAEGIIRQVASTVQAKRAPTAYGANGRASAPPRRAAAPVAVIRTL
ncbi:MAG: hypothetical protein FD152_1674 [Xanthobacteraceae bacterium]|nr:MAG: hypothetical protein FD152_1674 [Xanthobacteraceae bacterium]